MGFKLNWTQNKSLVVELLNGIENLQQPVYKVEYLSTQPRATYNGSEVEVAQ
jgi:hypothetical protein